MYEHNKQPNRRCDSEKQQRLTALGRDVYRSKIEHGATALSISEKFGDLPPVIQTEQHDADNFTTCRGNYSRQDTKAIPTSESDREAQG